jgi:hypothetical protein
MEPEEPEVAQGRIPTAQWWLIALALTVPGMAAAGLVCLSWFLDLRPTGKAGLWLAWGLLGGFLVLLFGCCIFAAGVLTHDSPPIRRRVLWVEWSFIFSFLQLALTPAVGAFILLPFML